MVRRFLVSFGIFTILGVFSLVLAEDMPVAVTPAVNADNAGITPEEGAAKANSDTQWVWGEVVSLDSQNKAITLKYLDYEADQEKEVVIKTDDKTSYENIKSFDEIKVKNNLSVDYALGAQGENIAKNINLEQQDNILTPDAAAPVSIPAPEAVPAETVVPTAVEPASLPAPVVPAPEVASPPVAPSSVPEAAAVDKPAETAPAVNEGK